MKAVGQILLKWHEVHGEQEYWYVIRREDSVYGYRIEGYWDENTGKSIIPSLSFPFTQQEVANEFKKQDREWRFE